MIVINNEQKSFFLQGKDFTYAMRVRKSGYLTNTYYGKKIAPTDLSYYSPSWVSSFNPTVPGEKYPLTFIMQEYATEYLGDYREPALIPVDGRGSRIADLKYDGYTLSDEKPAIVSGIPTSRGGETLIINLKDFDTGLSVKLYYTVYEEENILTRRAEIINGTSGDVYLDRALSCTIDHPDSNFELITFKGHHAEEKFPERYPLHHGISSVGNVRGTTTANHAPFTVLVRPETTEDLGEVFATNLIYSGSHYQSVEVDESGRTRVSCGINPQSFNWKLEVGQSFETPEVALGYSDSGLGKLSRQYHDFFRNYVISPKWVNKRRPVVLNSWEGMHFSFNTERLFNTIDKLKGTGIELFVLDDGWFGARNNDKAGLGDWFVNEEKLPGGLMPIANRCHENGLEFGLWIEPEMVNPDSDLYRAHPDWAIAVPDRTTIYSRNQYVLDFSRRDVLDYIKKLMYDVIANSGATYIKWDMNRPLTENWSYQLPADRQGELQHRYVLGVYELAKYLTESFPDILFEGCSGGGARFDGAVLAYFPQIWSSDNTDADDRTKIQYGTTFMFPLSSSSNHVSLSPNIRNGRIINASTRTNIAYGGIFGYEFSVEKYPEEDFSRIPADIEKYHKIDAIVREGDLYRGANRFESNECVISVVTKDKKQAFVTYYQALNPHKQNPKFKIPGLDASKMYHIEELDLTLPGDVLMNIGLVIDRFKCDFGSVNYILTAVD